MLGKLSLELPVPQSSQFSETVLLASQEKIMSAENYPGKHSFALHGGYCLHKFYEKAKPGRIFQQFLQFVVFLALGQRYSQF